MKRRGKRIARWEQPGSPKLPRIGPCRDPLDLWFLEFEHEGQVVRTYHEDRKAAGLALRGMRLKAKAAAPPKPANTPAQDRMLLCIDQHARPDGWAEWTLVYNSWDVTTMHPGLVGRAAQKCWLNLERRGLVEAQGDLVRRKAVN